MKSPKVIPEDSESKQDIAGDESNEPSIQDATGAEYPYDYPKENLNPFMASIDEALNMGSQFSSFYLEELKSPKIAFHKNYLYCGEADGMMKIYDMSRKQWIRNWKCHRCDIKMVSTSHDGKFIISSSDDCLVIWRDGLNMPKKLPVSQINDLCITFDNKWLLTASKSSELAKWSLETGDQLELLMIEIICLKVTYHNILYAAGADNIIYVYDLNTMKLINRLEGHIKRINCLQITNDDKWLLSGSNDGTIKLWDTNENIEKESIDTGFEEVLIIAISHNDKWFASADKWIKIWSFDDLSNPLCWHNSKNLWKDIKISIDSRFLFVGSDKYIDRYHIFNIITELEEELCVPGITGVYESYDPHYLIATGSKEIAMYNIFESRYIPEKDYLSMSNMKITGNGKYVFVGNDEKNSIECWDIDTFKKFSTLSDPFLNFTCFEITRDDKYLISSSIDDNNIIVWDISNILNIRSVTNLQAHKDRISLFYLTEDLKYLLSVSNENNGTTIIWEIGSWNQIAILEALPEIDCVVETSNYIICTDINHQICIWSKTDWKRIPHYIYYSHHMISLRNKKILISDSDMGISFWDLCNFEEIFYSPSPRVSGPIKITQNEQFLVFVSKLVIQIWDINKKTRVWKLKNSSKVRKFEIIYNDKFIVACLECGDLVLWSFEERNQVAVFANSVSNFVKDPRDDCMIVAESYDRTIFVYNIKNFVNHEFQWRKQIIHYDELPQYMRKAGGDSKTIFPLRINCLHIYCWNDDIENLKKALYDNPPIIKDFNNSTPLTYAIKKNAQRCIIEILNYILKIEDKSLRILYFHAIRDDICDLFRVQVNIVPLLSSFLIKKKYELIDFATSKRQLPITILSDFLKLNREKFDCESYVWWKRLICGYKNKIEKLKPIQYWISPIHYNFSMGSSDSLKLLKAIKNRDELEIYHTEFIKSLIRMKWDLIWIWIFLISLIFWSNLILMIFAIFTHERIYLWSFFIVNIPLFYIEFISFWSDRIGYFLSAWNYLDITRFIICLWWWNQELNEEGTYPASYFAAVINFLVGLLYFRAFNKTRFYVRLVLRAVYESIFFLIILIYSILGFSIIYATTDETASILSVWRQTYELEAGNFDNSEYSLLQYLYFTFAILINVILLLNLLVSVLGNSFSKLKEEELEIDLKEKLNLIIEMETALFWRKLWAWIWKSYRHCKSCITGKKYIEELEKKYYLQVCDYFQEETANSIYEDIKELKIEIKNRFEEMGNRFEDIKELKSDFKELKIEISNRFEQIGDTIEVIGDGFEFLSKETSQLQIKVNESLKKDSP